MHPFTFDDLDELVEELRAVDGVESVDLAASRVNPPGVWVSVRGVRTETLASVAFPIRLHLIGPSTEIRESMRTLERLHNAVVPTVNSLGGPTGDVELVALTLPDGATLPALVIPLDVSTT